MKIVGKWFNLVILLTILLILSFRYIKDNTPQYLPLGASVKIGDRTINLEVTRTINEQSKGLMFREALPDDRGMLFDFNPPDAVRFWMKNVPVPLDIVFIYQDRVVAIAHNVLPCKTDRCFLYPETPVTTDRVIELRSGLTKEIDLKLGERISIEKI